MVDIIIKKINPKGKTRSKIEEELNKDWGASGLPEEKIDKSKYLERVAKEQLGMDNIFIDQREIDKVK